MERELTKLKRVMRIQKNLHRLANQYHARGNLARENTLRFQADVVREGERLELVSELDIGNQRAAALIQMMDHPSCAHDICVCGHERWQHNGEGWQHYDLPGGCSAPRFYDFDGVHCGCKSFLLDREH